MDPLTSNPVNKQSNKKTDREIKVLRKKNPRRSFTSVADYGQEEEERKKADHKIHLSIQKAVFVSRRHHRLIEWILMNFDLGYMQGSPAKWVLPTGCKVKKWHLKPQTDRWTALAFCASLSLCLSFSSVGFFCFFEDRRHWGTSGTGVDCRLPSAADRLHTHTHTQAKTKIIIKTKVEKENKMKNPTRKLSQWGSRIEDLCLVRSRLEFSAGRGLFSDKKEQKYNTIFGDSHKTPKSGTPDPKRRSDDDDLVDAVCLNLPAIWDHEMFPKRC